MMAASTSAPSIPSTDSEPVDLGMTPLGLARAVHARRSEYVQTHRIRVKIGTWNIAACPGTDKDLASWFVDGEGLDQQLAALDLSHNPAVEQMERSSANAQDKNPDGVRLVGGNKIGLYVLGLQEVVDLNMTKDYMSRAVYADNSPVDKWKLALEAAMPPNYELVATEHMTGLLLLIYASPETLPTISNVSSKQVGTGLLGYFGNKGAVSTRLVLGETTRMVFVNCHLASGASSNYLDRRCWDVGQVLTKTQFDPVVHSGVVEDDGEKIGDEDFAFWFGDLNFRLDGLPGDDIRRLLTLHTRGEYDLNSNKATQPLDGEGVIVMRGSESDDDKTTLSSIHSREHSFDSESSFPDLPDPDDFPEDPSQDPASLQATLDSLLPHDQLRRVIAQRKVFHDGWREGPITFLPSYKYDVGTVALFDSSEKQRAPSWCDRILYRTRKDKQDYERKCEEDKEAKKKDEEMKSRGIDEDEDVLFSYNPDADGEELPKGSPGADYDEYDETDDREGDDIFTKEGFVDRISLDIYTSHQRITSSDHKPIISVFTLDYEAVVPELKAKIHAEVARELDRAENEGRPGVTIIVDGPESHDNVVDFGELGFLEKKSSTITIANTGGVPASFVFVEKPSTEDGVSATPSWLSTTFLQSEGQESENLGRSVTLEPGETVLGCIEMQISATSQVRALNDARTKLEDVLVLRVEGGRDHFIPVRGIWLPTCFGRSIDELIRIPDGGIRRFLQKKSINGSIPYDSDVHCSAPKELFKLTEAIQTLSERCMADEAMLEDMPLPRDAGWPFDASTWSVGTAERESLQAALVAALDTDAPVAQALPVELRSSHKLEIVSSVLLLFLASLTDGLIPPNLWAKLSTAMPHLASSPPTAWPDLKIRILDILASAPNHNIAFVFLTSTLARVATELIPATADPRLPVFGRRVSLRRGPDDHVANKRRTRERRYAEIFGPLTFRTTEMDRMTKEKERILIEMFLQRDEDNS